MKVYGKLILGILFLLLQIVVFLVNGFPQMNEGAYSFGYLAGQLAPGVIGIVLLAIYFLNKYKA